MARVTRRRRISAAPDVVWEIVSDPYSLPRWWPRATRVESVEIGSGDQPSRWTKVLQAAEGRSVRADFLCTGATDGERYAWEQQLEGTPFERHLRKSTIDIGIAPADGGTEVTIVFAQSLRGLSWLGSPMMRHSQSKIAEEALDGIERALAGGQAP